MSKMDHLSVINLCEVLINHAWNLLDQCYSASLCANQTLQLSNLIVSLRILIFDIKYMQSRVTSFYGWPILHQLKLNDYIRHFEKLQLEFEDTKSEQEVQVFRRQKILAFCQHIRWSIQEANYCIRVFPDESFQVLCHKQLVKYRKKVFSLILEKNDWSKKYLSRVRRYKNWALRLSSGVERNMHRRKTQHHERILEDLGILN